MQIKIKHIKTAPQQITITKRLYNQLEEKAALYDAYKAAQRKRGQKMAELLTPEQRSDKARKAALTRWNKRVNKED